MPRREAVDFKTRKRIAGHLRNKMRKMPLSQSAAAKILGVNQGTLSRVLMADGPVGLDLFIAIHRRLHIDANTLLDVDPEEPKIKTQ